MPPRTAASDWIATRATLLQVLGREVTPAVCEWKRIFQLSAFFAPYRSRMTFAQIRRAARTAISSKSRCER